MTEQRAYSYTVLRYVHDVVAEESLNVGVVIYTPAAGVLRGKTRKSIGRLKQTFPDIDLQVFRSTMLAIDRGITRLGSEVEDGLLFSADLDARGHAVKVMPEDDSSLQWSPVGSGLTSDVDATLERLFSRYVTRYDLVPEQRRTDRDIWRPVRTKLAERGVEVPFQEKTVTGSTDSIKFKSAWKNGSWHAYEAISLDLADENGIKDKARRWRGHLSAVAEGNSEDLRLHFLVGRPGNDSLVEAFECAKTILSGAHYAQEVVDENDVELLIASIEHEYRESEG